MTTGQTMASPVPAGPEAADLPVWREAFAGMDWMALHMSPVYAGIGVERGDGAPVILVPGFMASDASLLEMHAWLGRLGYRAYYSNIGRNVRCPDEHVERLARTVDQAYAETGRKVTLIGHSLGGCLARGVAISRPDKVAHVVSLGSPLQGTRIHPLVIAASRYIRRECTSQCYEHLQDALPESIAETCIYSKSDGIVDWHTCSRDSGATNIAVRGTHIGLIWNAQVYREVAKLLASESARDTAPAVGGAVQRGREARRRGGRPRIGRSPQTRYLRAAA